MPAARPRFLGLLIAAMAGGASLAHGAEGEGPAPRVQMPASAPMMQRPQPSVEVDVVVLVPSGTDGFAAEGMRRWAELAAMGFRISHIQASDGGRQVLFLERNAQAGQRQVRLPQVVEENPVEAQKLRQKILAEHNAQMRQPPLVRSPEAMQAVQRAPAPAPKPDGQPPQK